MADIKASLIKHDEHLLLDQPLLRLPNELLKKNFRSAHFTIEKDTTALKTMLKDTTQAATSGKASQEDVLKNLDAMISKMRGTKRKLEAHAQEESKVHDQIDARIAHVNDLYSIQTVDDVKYEAWSRKRLDRLLVDYLLREGLDESALELIQERQLQDLVDTDIFVKMNKIKESILAGRTQEALAWCTENKKELRKGENKLEFELRYQVYTDLIVQQKTTEAIAYAKKHLLAWRTLFPKEVQRLAGLLAYNKSHPIHAYGPSLSPTRWSSLAHLFTTTYMTILSLPPLPFLHVALSIGMSALKTPLCHEHRPREIDNLDLAHNGMCPVCSLELNELARKVPYAHHSQSHIAHDLRLLPAVRGERPARAVSQVVLERQAKAFSLEPGQYKAEDGGIRYIADLRKVFIT